MTGLIGDTVARSGYVRKARTGLLGFDALAGGLPAERMTVVCGGAGSGKTVFALQSLINGWQLYGEPGVFVSFEEDAKDLLAQAAGFGWAGTAEDDRVRVISARPDVDSVLAGDFDLRALLAGLGSLIDKMKAKRVVFDALDALLVLTENPAAERREFYRAYNWARDLRLTAIFTAKVDPGEQPLQRAFLEYLADAVIFLNHRLSEGTSVRGLRIVKCRGTAHSANQFPMVLDHRGIQVGGFTSPKLSHVVFEERMSTGIPRLDSMLGGGFHRGSAILVSGEPGTAKTLLTGAFVNAACNSGQRALLISFDETEGQITRNLRSIGTDLQPHIAADRLTIEAFRTGILSAEESFMILRDLLESLKPDLLAVDSISSLSKAGGLLLGVSVIERLLDYAKARGTTLVLTTLLERGVEGEATRIQISSLADTWISVSFKPLGGERNRALTVIKSRGTAHSNQVRELVLSSEGITLADVYSAGGEVLMGTARFERERENALLELERQDDHARRLEENASQQTQLRADIVESQRRLASVATEAERLQKVEHLRIASQQETNTDILGVRGTGSLEGSSASIHAIIPTSD